MAMSMRGTVVALLLAFAAVVVAVMVTLVLLLWPGPVEEDTYVLMLRDGSMLISDAGTAIGGFEYVGIYNVSLVSADGSWIWINPWMQSGEKVELRLELEIGLGDPISEAGKSEITVTVRYDPGADAVSLTGKEVSIVMPYFENDTVWDHEWDGYFIASWGGYAPEEELRGVISPETFGLPEHYYVELRMDFEITPPVVT